MAGLRYGVEIRGALPSDAADVATLLEQAGTKLDVRTAAVRLEALAASPDSAVLVAAGYGPLAGLVALHWGSTLQRPRPVARVTALVVDGEQRRQGIGRLLVKAGSQTARAAGCERLEVAAGDAPGFFQAIGFGDGETLLSRSLRKRAGGVG
jgi:aminoglycoside 6'-N-acetyltransferase I